MTVISHFLSPYRLYNDIGSSSQSIQHKTIEDYKYIEKVANAIGKKVTKALDKFENNQAHNTWLAKIRAYEANRYVTRFCEVLKVMR